MNAPPAIIPSPHALALIERRLAPPVPTRPANDCDTYWSDLNAALMRSMHGE